MAGCGIYLWTFTYFSNQRQHYWWLKNKLFGAYLQPWLGCFRLVESKYFSLKLNLNFQNVLVTVPKRNSIREIFRNEVKLKQKNKYMITKNLWHIFYSGSLYDYHNINKLWWHCNVAGLFKNKIFYFLLYKRDQKETKSSRPYYQDVISNITEIKLSKDSLSCSCFKRQLVLSKT